MINYIEQEQRNDYSGFVSMEVIDHVTRGRLGTVVAREAQPELTEKRTISEE